jgi:recombination protein RecA
MDEKMLTAIQKKYKDSVFKKASEIKLGDLKPISTGSLALDLALCIPLAYGIIEYAGQEGVGKTTLALEAIANAQKNQFNTFYINIERSLNEKSFDGIDIDRESLMVMNPDSGEKACDFIEDVMRGAENNFIVIDSVATMQSEVVMAESNSKNFMAMTARMMSQFLPKAVNLAEGSKSVILLINQLRDNPGYGAPEYTPGGRAVKYLTSERVFFKTNKASRIVGKNDGEYHGHEITAEVVKNRFAPPFKKASIPIFYLPGPHIDKQYEAASMAIDFGVVEGKGWLTLKNEAGEEIDKWHGKSNFVTALKENGDLYNTVKDRLSDIVG